MSPAQRLTAPVPGLPRAAGLLGGCGGAARHARGTIAAGMTEPAMPDHRSRVGSSARLNLVAPALPDTGVRRRTHQAPLCHHIDRGRFRQHRPYCRTHTS